MTAFLALAWGVLCLDFGMKAGTSGQFLRQRFPVICSRPSPYRDLLLRQLERLAFHLVGPLPLDVLHHGLSADDAVLHAVEGERRRPLELPALVQRLGDPFAEGGIVAAGQNPVEPHLASPPGKAASTGPARSTKPAAVAGEAKSALPRRPVAP